MWPSTQAFVCCESFKRDKARRHPYWCLRVSFGLSLSAAYNKLGIISTACIWRLTLWLPIRRIYHFTEVTLLLYRVSFLLTVKTLHPALSYIAGARYGRHWMRLCSPDWDTDTQS